VPRYRFGDFLLSPRRRLLVRAGREEPLIPKYFDLLVLLVERRGEAVHRREIFDSIWKDVIVSDSALSQAIRTIRRTLGDDSREPRFVRTVSRHGYQFVFAEVIEEEDNGPWRTPAASGAAAEVVPVPGAPAGDDPFEPLLARLTRPAATMAEQEDQREAAELLHALGTAEALARLGTRPGHAVARALLRDTRWEAPQAGAVPIAGAPATAATAARLVRLRLARAAAMIRARWAGASIGGGLAGMIAGGVGGLILAAAPGSSASAAIAPVLALIGGACGAAGGAGVGAGLALAESSVRSWRTLPLVAGAAAGGSAAGAAAQWLGRWSLAALVGVRVDTGGALEGFVLGAAAGLGYALATPHVEGGLAAPRGRRRLAVAALTAAACGLAALGLTLVGRPLVGGTVHVIAQAAGGAQATLGPLGRLLGEPDFGPITASLIGTAEGALFGFGLAWGMARRPS
jgi:DNA-binding winged helix-turn-helix (wHTH) protein